MPNLKTAFICVGLVICSPVFSAVTLLPLTALPINLNREISNGRKTHDSLMIERMRFYSSLTVKDYEKLHGKKMNFLEKKLFRISQHRMKHILKTYDYGDGPNTFQKIGWLCKGILFGPIAVGLAYLFLKDEERELIKWAWFGCIGFVAIVIVLLIAAAG